jgi:hypothetical protein
MPDPPFDVGDTVRLRTAITDTETGSPAVPSQVTLQTRAPAGSLASYSTAGASPPTALASGVFRIDIPLTAPGVWRFRWVATGPNSVEEFTLPVASSYFVP